MRTEFGVAQLDNGAYAAVVSGTFENEKELAVMKRVPWAEPRIVGDCAVMNDTVVHFSRHKTAEEARQVAEAVACRISFVMEERILEEEIGDLIEGDTGMYYVHPSRSAGCVMRV